MNLKHRLNHNSCLLLLGATIIIGVMVFLNTSQNQKDIKLINEKPDSLRELKQEELSPDGLNKIILYQFIFDPIIYREYYKDYFNNNIVVSVRDMENGKEDYIFTGSRIGEPKWLGNEHVFFTSYCGSGCQGIYLIDVFNKETEQGVLSYMISGDDESVYTHFKDWFGHEFKFNGWINEIRSETIDNKTYLIFYMRDDEQKSIGQKRFLFTGDALKE